MTIFVSDTHFGRSSGKDDLNSERDLIACLDRAGSDLDALYLVGDIFEHYVEYRHLVPKGNVRFLATLAALTDAGVPVKYFVGNHDPWHRDYFQTELGVEVIQNDSVEPLYGFDVYVTHGDGLGREAGFYRLLKPVLRHAIPVSLYRGVLPSDLGMALAKWYGRTFTSETVNEVRTRSLREAAVELLAGNRYDLVVMGHSHAAELLQTDGGMYMNCGCWHSDQTLAVLDSSGPSLKQWRNSTLIDYAR